MANRGRMNVMQYEDFGKASDCGPARDGQTVQGVWSRGKPRIGVLGTLGGRSSTPRGKLRASEPALRTTQVCEFFHDSLRSQQASPSVSSSMALECWWLAVEDVCLWEWLTRHDFKFPRDVRLLGPVSGTPQFQSYRSFYHTNYLSPRNLLSMRIPPQEIFKRQPRRPILIPRSPNNRLLLLCICSLPSTNFSLHIRHHLL